MYLGRGIDKLSNVEVLDNITFDGSSSYTLQKNSVNFTPSSANNILVSIDGVVQSGNFTVSGSTIDFGTAVAGTSTCNFIIHYGIGLITTPADGTVTTAKIQDSAVTTAKLADSAVSLTKLSATGTKDATTFLRGDNTFASAGGINTPLVFAYSSAVSGVTSDTWTKMPLSNEIYDTNNCFDSTTNYRFTPNVAGKYFLGASMVAFSNSNNLTNVRIKIYKNGSILAGAYQFVLTASASVRHFAPNIFTIDQANGTTDYYEVYYYMSGSSLYLSNDGETNRGNHLLAYKIIE